eukprot:gene30426-52558_t
MGVLSGYLGAAPSLLWASGAMFIAMAPLLVPLAIWIYTLVFAFASLWFAHYALGALQRMRAVVPVERAPSQRVGRRQAAERTGGRTMTTAIGLIIIGDEILSGKRADKHLPKVIELLGARGMSLSWARFVGDDRQSITANLRDAFAHPAIVFSCGGIGATPDDHTRQCAAAALGVELALHPQAKLLIESRMRDVAVEQGQVFDPRRPDNVHRYNMGVFPVGATIIEN